MALLAAALPVGSVPLQFSLRARTAFEAAEEAFERALADPDTEQVVVPADGWAALIGLAALYAAIPGDGEALRSTDDLVDQACKVFRDALNNIRTHPPKDLLDPTIRGFTIRTASASETQESER